MIRTEDLKKIVKLTLLSGYIKKHKPLSLMLIAVAGNGKTEIISTFKSSRTLYLTDLSYMGLLKHLKENSKINHVIIPDFLKITQKKKSTSDNLVSLLNALVEEGVGRISIYNFDHDFKGKQLGIIIATTKASFSQRKKQWESIGFISRMLMCSYSYSEETEQEIMDYINSEEYLKEVPQIRLSGFKSVAVTSEKELNQQLNVIAKRKFRTLKHLQTLAKAHALLRGDSKVTKQDIEEVKRLAKHLNLNYKKI